MTSFRTLTTLALLAILLVSFTSINSAFAAVADAPVGPQPQEKSPAASPSATQKLDRAGSAPIPGPTGAPAAAPVAAPVEKETPPSNASPSNTPPSSASPINTPSPAASPAFCESGVCVPEGKSQKCIILESKWSLRELRKTNATAHLPTDLRAYFQARFPKYWKQHGHSFPEEFKSMRDLDEIFGGASWALMTRKFEEFSVQQSDCHLPRQRYLRAWFYLDVFQFYLDRKDACAVGGRFPICGSTLDERAKSVNEDISDQKVCKSSPKGPAYLKEITEHVQRSNNEDICVHGDIIDADFGRCGYNTEIGACMRKDECPKLIISIAERCPALLTNLDKALLPTDVDIESSALPTMITTISIAAIVVIGALVALVKSRKTSLAKLKRLESTLIRTLSRRRTGKSTKVTQRTAIGEVDIKASTEEANFTPTMTPTIATPMYSAMHETYYKNESLTEQVYQYVDSYGELKAAPVVPAMSSADFAQTSHMSSPLLSTDQACSAPSIPSRLSISYCQVEPAANRVVTINHRPESNFY